VLRALTSSRLAYALTVSHRWIGPVAVLVVAAVARLWNLGNPASIMFDETYYVKDAWTLWHQGFEANWPSGFKDSSFAAGDLFAYKKDLSAEFVSHPPLGKWIIGIGEILTGGTNPAGWRISVALIGILSVALLMLVAHRLFENLGITVLAGGLFAIDNLAIVMSRIALLDNMVMFFALAGFACLIEDRKFIELRFGRWLMSRRHRAVGGWGPTLLWRPWLMLAALAFGLDSAVKWSGLYFFVAFGAYVILVDMMLRRRAGIRFWYSAGILKQLPATLLVTVPITLFTYLICFSGYFVTAGGYDRQYLAEFPKQRWTGLLGWVPGPVQDLWQWHVAIYQALLNLDTPHRYKAPAILWPLIARPTAMFYAGTVQGQGGCTYSNCAAETIAMPNPLIWYAGIAASLYLVYRFARFREWQVGAMLMGYVGGYLPWLLYGNRTIFFFYTIAFEPYLILCLAATIGLMLRRPAGLDSYDEITAEEAAYRWKFRRRTVGVFLTLAVIVSIFYYPLSSGMQIPYWYWHIHMWSPTWV
jgi:dolichyl-phosphate-mannose-protein mannosyltransferase